MLECNKMITKKIAYLLIFSLFLGVSGVALGATDDTRYLVRSQSGFWKKSFGVRHEFVEGFTTDLNDWQLRVARVFGVEVLPVKKLFILPSEAVAKDSPPIEPLRRPTAAPKRTLPSDQLPWGIKAVYGNDPTLLKTSGGLGVSVAILDTGIFKDHLDLKNRVTQCKDFTSPKTPIVVGKCDDKNGHGTHVAGTIAADSGNDGKGIYGVAPETNLFAYKVCGNNGTCWSDDVAVAITKAADDGAQIINLSLGGDSPSSLINNAISYAVNKNVLVVAAAGNDGPETGTIDYPAANPEVIAAGAFGVGFNIADWSSRGINSATTANIVEEGDIEFASPGVIVESTWNNGGYVILSGTSMAAPHISGLAAKLWQKDAEDPDSATRNLLHTFSSDLLPAGDDDASGFGFPHL